MLEVRALERNAVRLALQDMHSSLQTIWTMEQEERSGATKYTLRKLQLNMSNNLYLQPNDAVVL